jgi:hypothetical protein
MATEEWDGAPVHPGFQERRGTAVPEGRKACAGGEARSALGAGGELRRGSERQGRRGVVAGKAPRRRAGEVPGGPQCGKETRGQESGAVLTACALMDAEQPAIPCDSGAAQAHDCPDAPTRGRGRQEYGAMPRGGGAGAQALECFATQEGRQEPPSRPWGHVEVACLPAAGRDGATLPPIGDLGTGTPRAVACDQYMVERRTELVRAQGVGGTARALGEAGDGSDSGLLGLGSMPRQRPVLGHLRASGGHGVAPL